MAVFLMVPIMLCRSWKHSRRSNRNWSPSVKVPSTLRAQIVRLEVIDDMGTIQTIEGENLKAWRMNLGLLGIIVKATMGTIPCQNYSSQNTWAWTYFKLCWWRRFHNFSCPSYRLPPNGLVPSVSKVVVIHGNFTNDVSLPGYFYFYSTFIKDVSPETVTIVSEIYDLLQERRNLSGFWPLEENASLALTSKVTDNGQNQICTSSGTDSANRAAGYGWKIMSAHALYPMYRYKWKPFIVLRGSGNWLWC